MNQEQTIKAFFEIYKSKEAQRDLKPLLSPLEAALIKNGLKPFVFKYNRKSIFINAYYCLKIQNLLSERCELFADICQKHNQSVTIPLELRETFDDPAQIVNLPQTTRQQLIRLKVYTLFHIMRLGRKHFVDLPDFGAPSVAALDRLFKKHKCSHLFK